MGMLLERLTCQPATMALCPVPAGLVAAAMSKRSGRSIGHRAGLSVGMNCLESNLGDDELTASKLQSGLNRWDSRYPIGYNPAYKPV